MSFSAFITHRPFSQHPVDDVDARRPSSGLLIVVSGEICCCRALWTTAAKRHNNVNTGGRKVERPWGLNGASFVWDVCSDIAQALQGHFGTRPRLPICVACSIAPRWAAAPTCLLRTGAFAGPGVTGVSSDRSILSCIVCGLTRRGCRMSHRVPIVSVRST